MKRLTAIMFITLTMLSMTACTTKRTSEASRMIEIENADEYRVVYDKYTKVMYAVSDGAYNYGTFTLLVDADGKPLLYRGGQDE